MPKWFNKTVSMAEKQLLLAANASKDSLKNPRTFEHGKTQLVTERDWTSGFFSGSLWYAYELSNNKKLKLEAQRFMMFVENAKYRTNTHDLGFILNSSFGNSYRLNKDLTSRDVLITAANTLMNRYNSNLGLIKSWDKIVGPWEFPVIIDNMLNLELLMVASELSLNNEFKLAAISHADVTLKNHFRIDNSCFHVVNYDTVTYQVISKETHQGYNHQSSWARGQAWALYGFTMMYRYTRNQLYLEKAEAVASFILNHPNLPSDKIPYWDFNAPGIPNEPRDASAAAVIASGLLELSTFSSKKAYYFRTAESILKTLASDKYISKLGENGNFLLLHSTGNWPKKSEIDAPITYADYYFLEALTRYKSLK